MNEQGRVIRSEGLKGKVGKKQLNEMVEAVNSVLTAGLLDPAEFTSFKTSDDELDFLIYALNNPKTRKMDFWVGTTGERCPFLDEDGYVQVRLSESSSNDDSEKETAEQEDDSDDSFSGLLGSGELKLPSQSEIFNAMRQHHLGKRDDIQGVTPKDIKLRMERVPPFRLRLFQGGKMTHELPLWSLGIVHKLKHLLGWTPFCFEDDDETGGIFDGTNNSWVAWSSDEDGGNRK